MSTCSQRVPGRNQPFSTTSKKKGVPGYGAATWKRAISSGSFLENSIVCRMGSSLPGKADDEITPVFNPGLLRPNQRPFGLIRIGSLVGVTQNLLVATFNA